MLGYSNWQAQQAHAKNAWQGIFFCWLMKLVDANRITPEKNTVEDLNSNKWKRTERESKPMLLF